MAAVPTTIHKAVTQGAGRLAVPIGRDRVRNPITTHIAPIPTTIATNTYGRTVAPSIVYMVLLTARSTATCPDAGSNEREHATWERCR
jgi:hypothetical protein